MDWEATMIVTRYISKADSSSKTAYVAVSMILVTVLLSTIPGIAAETVTYTYDSMKRITRVDYGSIPVPGPVIEYVYDNMGNRLVRSEYATGVPANSAPSPATSPSPANTAIGVTGPLTISWTGSDPNPGDRLSFFVLAGTNANALQPIWSGSATSFNPWNLAPDTTYYWKVVTRDNHNAETSSGPPWIFTTGSTTVNALPLNLDVFLTGTGSGSVTSVNPAGIVCTGAVNDVCAKDVTPNTSVTLSAVSSTTSRFEGWSVTSCPAVPDYTTPPFLPIPPASCSVPVTEDTSVAATFNLIPPIRIVLTYPGFEYPYEMDSLDTASGMLLSFGTYASLPMAMQSHDKLFTGDFVFNSGLQAVRWRGGYNSDYSSVIGTTRIMGKLTVTGGKLIVERILIR